MRVLRGVDTAWIYECVSRNNVFLSFTLVGWDVTLKALESLELELIFHIQGLRAEIGNVAHYSQPAGPGEVAEA